MGGILRRSLGLLLAMALVIAGLPVAHAMPVAAATSAMHHGHADVVSVSMDHAHHCDDMAMDAAPAPNEGDPADTAAPCKCLNCSMCVANFVAPPLRLATPERRLLAVIYRIDAVYLAGIAAPIDPSIPILAS